MGINPLPIISVATAQPTGTPPTISRSTLTNLIPSVLPPRASEVMSNVSESSSARGGLLLLSADAVLPQKVVDKIRGGKFIELKELLQDNLSLATQLDELQGTSSTVHVVGVSRPRLRDITSLAAWCYCFVTYVATMTTDPITRDQLAYARHIIQQSQSQGGLGFLDYDRAFRQQVAADQSLRWNTVNPSLLASTVLGHAHRYAPQSFCTLCRAADHTRPQCALNYLQPQLQSASYGLGSGTSGLQARQRRNMRIVCNDFNKGVCSRGANCRFPHACRICFQRNHPATHCPRAYAGNSAGPSPAYVGPPPTYTGPLASAPPPNPAGAR